MIQELSTVLAGVKHEQEYMEIRDNVHRASEFFLICKEVYRHSSY
jgi:hypothetical protein